MESLTELQELSTIQSRLVTVGELLDVQNDKNVKIDEELRKLSYDVICELRLLSLVRSEIVCPMDNIDIKTFINSQTMKGLKFSEFDHSPIFFSRYSVNYINTFAKIIQNSRLAPTFFAKTIYHYSISHPENVYHMAYCVFLCLFQQGWCIEEDLLMTEVLKALVTYQCNKKPPKEIYKFYKPTEIALQSLYPLDKYVESYLFNCSSLAYLQFSLSQIVSILHSSSSLRKLHNTFTKRDGLLAQFEYWEIIVQQALSCFDKLLKCVELLPAGVASLFKHIRENMNKGDEPCILLFFESFINKALDNPSVLGLVPWHPDGAEWSPSKDISTVFRARYVHPSPSILPLKKVLSKIDGFDKIDFKKFFDHLTDLSVPHTILISETELLHNNPIFPKDIIITGEDIWYFQEALRSVPKEEVINDPVMYPMIKDLPDFPELNDDAKENFMLEVHREAKIRKEAESIEQISLFNISDEAKSKKENPYASCFCNALVLLPRFNTLIDFIKPESTESFLETMKILAPHFISEDKLRETNVALSYYAYSNISIKDLIPKLEEVTANRYTKAMEIADLASSLNTQHQRVLEANNIIKTMRENVQSNLLHSISEMYIHRELSNDFIITMSKSYEFTNNFPLFNKCLDELKEIILGLAIKLNMSEKQTIQCKRIIFFTITQHITCNQFLKSNQNLYKNNCIIQRIIKANAKEITEKLIQSSKDEICLRKKYLEKASDILGHIRPTFGISVILYYINEFVTVITELTNECPMKLNIAECILWAILRDENSYSNIYSIGKFVDRFLLKSSLTEVLLTSESQHISLFSSVMCILLNACGEYDPRIKEWDNSI